jgi:ABC-type lipoprotein export system ATPase subunit
MLTRLIVRNFKRFGEVDIELGNPVVFIGPNNSGKTTALQALALWEIGVRRWHEKRGGKATPEKRPGVTINRRDLIAVPVPQATLLWKDLHVRDVESVNGKPRTENIRIEIIVEGVGAGGPWKCGLEFDYANEESFYCRPLRLAADRSAERMPIPEAAPAVTVSFLPPMSGLADREFSKQPGEVNFLIGQGRTAEVLRNLCYQLVNSENGALQWQRIENRIESLFGVSLDAPVFVPERGELTMAYRERSDKALDLSSSGRGLQQTLLLLTYMAVHPGSVLLLDEPDAHLEILRQRQVYQLLTEEARQQGSQIIAASHSEVILNEAADRDVVVAFVGRPHRIDDRGSQLLKSLKEIGFEQYYQAEQRGWVLYLEGSTDLAILRAFAETLDHPAKDLLQRLFVHYVQNLPGKAYSHFYGLREAKQDLVGLLVCDRLQTKLEQKEGLVQRMWQRRELENYLCQPETLVAWAEDASVQPTGEAPAGELFKDAAIRRWREIMSRCIGDLVPPVALRDRSDKWWRDMKASDEFLDRLFEIFYREVRLENLMRKTDYHVLARFVPRDQISPEVVETLEDVVEVASRAHPVDDSGVHG